MPKRDIIFIICMLSTDHMFKIKESEIYGSSLFAETIVFPHQDRIDFIVYHSSVDIFNIIESLVFGI